MDIKEQERLVKEAKKIKSGPNRPFGKLYEEFSGKIKNYFLARTKEESLAEDLTSQTFQKALDGLDTFRWEGVPFSSWLFTIARNTFFDHLRSQKGKQKVDLENTPTLKSQTPTQFEELTVREEKEWLQKALFKLPEREREIVYLKFYEGLTNRAIAKITDLSETNVGTILYRTLRKLKEDLEKDPN